MSISTLESATSRRMLDSAATETATRVEAENALAQEFMAAARVGNMAATAWFAPLTTVWAGADYSGKRRQTVGEVLTDSLQYDQPPASDVMALLCAVSQGKDQTVMAQMLLTRMARTWAAQNVGEPE